MRFDIPPLDFAVRPHYIFSKQSMLLTAGDYAAGKFNAMTIGDGSFGIMWGKPFALVIVRPSRYTYEFMETYPSFTLCAFGPAHAPALKLLGSKSGRDGDKITESGLTVAASSLVAAPCFREAELVVECRKTYWDDLDPNHILTPKWEVDSYYPSGNFHRVYFGEVLAVHGIVPYRA